MITKPPAYKEGKYSTHYFPNVDVEKIIFQYKGKRVYPKLTVMSDHFKKVVIEDK